MADEPDGHANLTFLGNLRFIAGEYEDAIRSYSRALSLAPDDLPARGPRSRALGDPDAIMAVLDRASAAVPDEIPLLAVRCARRRSGGDAAGAEADRVRLLELGFDITQP